MAPEDRTFALFPAAVAVVMVNDAEEVLLLEGPGGTTPDDRRPRGALEIPSGAIEEGESVLDALAREITEELGPDVGWRFLGTVHTYTIDYDGRPLISVVCLVEYEGGEVVPGDDAAGSTARWVASHDIDHARITVPSESRLLDRAIDLYRLWR